MEIVLTWINRTRHGQWGDLGMRLGHSIIMLSKLSSLQIIVDQVSHDPCNMIT